jgi:hypothetical protein
MKSLFGFKLFVFTMLVILNGCKTDSSNPTQTDTTAPVVSISAPTNNSTVTDSVLITASASDKVGVEKVEFYIDGILVQTRSTSPWQYKWDVRDLHSNITHAIRAKAYDAAGNIGSSSTITVSVNKTIQALQFNGVSDLIRLPSSSSLTSFQNKIAIEAWIRLNSYGSQGGAIIASGNENEYSFAIRSNGKLGVTMVMVNPQINHEFISKSALALSTWYHVAFTYDGSLESIFINGVVDTTFTTSGNISTAQYTEYISIGAYTLNNTPYSSFFNGIIDEVRVWNINRTQQQIQSNMYIELSGIETGLVGYWNLNGNSLDKTSNVNDGTILGNPVFVTLTR